MTTLERITTAIMIVILVLCFVAIGAAYADDGICTDDNGVEGISTAWGVCMTPELYSELYSYENLAQVPSAINPEISIAEEAGLVPDGIEAADRELGAGVVAEPFTFREYVRAAHEPRAV